MRNGPKNQNENTGKEFEDIIEELFWREDPAEKAKDEEEEEEEH